MSVPLERRAARPAWPQQPKGFDLLRLPGLRRFFRWRYARLTLQLPLLLLAVFAVFDGLTGDQRFFLAWAQVWRSQQRDDNARVRLRTDSHSPEQYRTNGAVRQMDAWYKAFGVKPDDALYLPPEQRVKIW